MDKQEESEQPIDCFCAADDGTVLRGGRKTRAASQRRRCERRDDRKTEVACEAPALPSSVVLEEYVNQKVAHYLMTLKADDLQKYSPPSKHHCKTEDDFKAALTL